MLQTGNVFDKIKVERENKASNVYLREDKTKLKIYVSPYQS